MAAVERQAMAAPRMGAGEWGMLFALSLLWGGSFFFVGVAVREVPPFTIVAARVGIAAMVLWAAVWALRLHLPTRPGIWAAFLRMGLLNNAIPFALFTWGQLHIASGLAAILNATTPLFTVLVAHALTGDERLSPGKAAGVVLGLAGVVAMLGPALLAGLGPWRRPAGAGGLPGGGAVLRLRRRVRATLPPPRRAAAGHRRGPGDRLHGAAAAAGGGG